MGDSPQILHVVWNLIRGGTEGQCARVALALAERGWRQRVAVFRREGLFLERVEQACGPVHHLDIHSLRRLSTWRHVAGLVRWLRAERIDLVHAWDADAVIFAGWAARCAGVPLITSRRDLSEIYPAWKLWAMRKADRRARAVVVNAEAIRRRVVDLGMSPSRVVCMPNVVDVAEFDRLAARPFPQPDRLPPGRLVVYVARLDPEKDVATFLRAAHQVTARVPDARFVVAGEGRERPSLEQLHRDLRLGDRLVLLGEVADVPALLARASVGVLCPSANEGLSNSILEYMCARLPVVATDCGGNAELVRQGVTGHVVPAGDAAALADRLARLLEDPETAQAQGRAGRAMVEQRHGISVVTDAFATLYQRARHAPL